MLEGIALMITGIIMVVFAAVLFVKSEKMDKD